MATIAERGGAVAAMLTRDETMASEASFELPNVYEALGVKPIINAWL